MRSKAAENGARALPFYLEAPRSYVIPQADHPTRWPWRFAHRADEVVILDCLVEKPAPFNAAAVTAEMAQTLREYGLTSCRGDRYGAQWVVQSFAAHGITYALSARDRSALYADGVPLFTSGRARLLGNRKLINQFAALERRTSATRDKIDHPRGARDDCANAAAGALVAAADRMK